MQADKGGEESSFEVSSHCASLLITTADAVSRAQTMAQQQQARKDQGKTEPAKDPLDAVALYVAKKVASGAEPVQASSEESDEASSTLGKLRTTLVTLLSKKKMSDADTLEARKQAEAIKHLVTLLELHCVVHPATADVALATDLEKVVGSVFLGADKSNEEEGEEAVHWEDALVDIVLTILSRNETPLPSAPLRDAAERLFKAFASHVTATGVEDLLQVVARPVDEKESDDESEGDESDEEMEEDEKESGSEEESEEEEEE